MKTKHTPQAADGGQRRLRFAVLIALAMTSGVVQAHIVPPEVLHPMAESYRRMTFLLELNPVLWPQVETEAAVLADGLTAVAPSEGASYREAISGLVTPPAIEDRRATAGEVFLRSTRAVARTLERRLELARDALDDYPAAKRELEEARQLWAAFEPAVAAVDPDGFRRLGERWLELTSALGNPGVLGIGAIPSDRDAFVEDSAAMIAYLDDRFGDRDSSYEPSESSALAPIPAHRPATYSYRSVPARLPPGSNLNKQLPRPRQVLNMAEHGVDEKDTTLIALGDMAFDSAGIFGEPARSLGISCNTCHNKSITNPGFFIPGLSSRPGTVDVSNAFFAPHANNGRFDPLDIPDLRGIRFTSPYGFNGRFESLREFVRNVIVNEFNGPEPDPVMLDGMIAYMLEFDFLPNPDLGPDGRLTASASDAAKRGEEIFNRPFEGMGGRACATCHVPSDHFLDRRSHDVGTIAGTGPGSRDRALDTPTLLSSRYTAPYFHDGSQPTLRAVNEWFDERFELGLSESEIDDLTAYLETIGDGTEAYEDTIHTLEAELEEFSFFLSTYEFLRDRGKADLINTTFETIAFEIRAHKWDVQDDRYLPVLDQLAELMDEALAANRRGEHAQVDRTVAAYRSLYSENAEVLR